MYVVLDNNVPSRNLPQAADPSEPKIFHFHSTTIGSEADIRSRGAAGNGPLGTKDIPLSLALTLRNLIGSSSRVHDWVLGSNRISVADADRPPMRTALSKNMLD